MAAARGMLALSGDPTSLLPLVAAAHAGGLLPKDFVSIDAVRDGEVVLVTATGVRVEGWLPALRHVVAALDLPLDEPPPSPSPCPPSQPRPPDCGPCTAPRSLCYAA